MCRRRHGTLDAVAGMTRVSNEVGWPQGRFLFEMRLYLQWRQAKVNLA